MPDSLEPAALQNLNSQERLLHENAVHLLLSRLRTASAGLDLAELPAVSFQPLPAAGIRNSDRDASQRAQSHPSPFAESLGGRTADELCQALLTEIGKRNPQWNAFARVHPADATAAARQADISRSSGRPWGDLHGVPVAVKENIAVKGWPLTGSSKVLQDEVATSDATVISRLRHSGVVLVGQTIMHELAFGMTSINPHLGAVRNPWDPSRICGGSSGGAAAAVAGGLVQLALGSETGGSVRCPAALCGVAGFKPSFGSVSRHGVLPLGGSLDTVGPIARKVSQCLAAHLAMEAEDPLDVATYGVDRRPLREAPRSLEGLRVGLPRPYFGGAMDEGVRRQVNLAVERIQEAGAQVRNIDFPDLEALNAAASITLLVEAASFFGPSLSRREQIGEDVRGRFEQGLLVPAVDWVDAQRLRARWKREVATIFTECDLLITPSSPVSAPRIDDPYIELGGVRVDARTAISRYLRSFNFLGLPALSLPCGLDDEGLPVGLQLVAPGFEDEWLLRTGILVESLIAFDSKPPGATF